MQERLQCVTGLRLRDANADRYVESRRKIAPFEPIDRCDDPLADSGSRRLICAVEQDHELIAGETCDQILLPNLRAENTCELP